MISIIKSRLLLALLLTGMLICNQPLEGQIIFGQPPAGDIKFIYQSWKIEDDSGQQAELSQWVLPIYGFLPLRDNLELILTSSTAGSSQSLPDNSEAELTGLNDSRISLYSSFLDDHLLLGLGLNLPTGKKALDAEEVGVVAWLTESFFNFPIKSYGEGFAVNLETGYAYAANGLAFGAGLGYTLKASYEPLSGVEDYKPGNQFKIGCYGSYEKSGLLGKLSMLVNLFSDDQLDGRSVFRDGAILDLRQEIRYKRERMITALSFREILRGKDRRLGITALETEPEKSHGTEIRVLAEAGYGLNQRISLSALLEYKRVGANGYPEDHVRYFGSSDYFGIGCGIGAAISKVISSRASFKYYSGSADDDIFDLRGWEIILALGASF